MVQVRIETNIQQFNIFIKNLRGYKYLAFFLFINYLETVLVFIRWFPRGRSWEDNTLRVSRRLFREFQNQRWPNFLRCLSFDPFRICFRMIQGWCSIRFSSPHLSPNTKNDFARVDLASGIIFVESNSIQSRSSPCLSLRIII